MSELSARSLPLFSQFPTRRILFEDDSIVVVDKPWGLATHPPEDGRTDDVASFLKAHYRALGQSDYLGIHQRLDRETSGVMLFARDKAQNKSLAEQFEGRRAKKTYLAVVCGRVFEKMTLRHVLSKGKDGTMIATEERAAKKSGERGLLAITELSLVERRGKHSLVRLELETGRTHQIRAQLAAIGAPIVGDDRYGGVPAHRPLLHSHTLSLSHPKTGEALSFEAATPPDLLRGLDRKAPDYSDPAELALRLEDAACRRFGIVSCEGGSTALRLAHGGGDELPDASVEIYEQHAVLSLYREFSPSENDALGAALLRVGARGVYVKHRPKVASRIVDSRRDDIAPTTPLVGEPAEPSFLVREDGIDYEVHLADGLSTGLFLDQRDNRRRIRDLANGQRVLNLFAYTGSFSVAAAVGGARSTTSVDVSANVLEWTTRNLERAGFTGEAHRIVAMDVARFLDREKKRAAEYDLIVLDPPSFSSTKAGVFSVQNDFAPLAASCLSLLSAGGTLLASTNHRTTSADRFRKILHDAGRLSGRQVAKVRSYGPAADFPPEPGQPAHLKAAQVTLGR